MLRNRAPVNIRRMPSPHFFAAPHRAAVHSPATVLILEQNAALREATRMLLQTEGYCVVPAGSLPSALALSGQNPAIDLLLVHDTGADGTLGVRAIAELRQAIGRPLRALLLTGHISSSLRTLEEDGSLWLAPSSISADGLIELLRALRPG